MAAANKGKGKAPDPAKDIASALDVSKPVLKCIFVHVQVGNEDAKVFWKAQGFKETEAVKEYYKPTIEGSRDAWILERVIELEA